MPNSRPYGEKIPVKHNPHQHTQNPSEILEIYGVYKTPSETRHGWLQTAVVLDAIAYANRASENGRD